jgi:plasmid stability protein
MPRLPSRILWSPAAVATLALRLNNGVEWGAAAALRTALERHGRPVTRQAVSLWLRRGVTGAESAAALDALAVDHGVEPEAEAVQPTVLHAPKPPPKTAGPGWWTPGDIERLGRALAGLPDGPGWKAALHRALGESGVVIDYTLVARWGRNGVSTPRRVDVRAALDDLGNVYGVTATGTVQSGRLGWRADQPETWSERRRAARGAGSRLPAP